MKPEPVEDLIGRTALVTGAGRGLGRAYALQLARQGADVAIVDVDLRSYREFDREAAQMTAETTAKEVEALGRRSVGIELDASNAPAIQEAVAEIVSAWGHLDIAVCNAGGGLGTPAETRASTMDASQYEAVVSRNLHGTVHTCRAVAAPMPRAALRQDHHRGESGRSGEQPGGRVRPLWHGQGGDRHVHALSGPRSRA